MRLDRTDPDTDIEAYMIAQLYIAERGCAATEFFTQGKQEALVAISDYANYNSANAPPFLSLRESMSKLQRIYPERLKRMIISDPPFWMRMLFNMLSPFLAEKTTDKILMISGKNEKKSIFSDVFDIENTLPLMTDNLTLSVDTVNIKSYVDQLMYETLASVSK